jgi:phosphatidylglycerol:prolipoprotein diacylglycerol transferase
MKIDGIYHQPTFLYESLWNVLGFILMLLIRHTRWIKSGQLFAFYLIWYGLGRFMIEDMRTDSLMIADFRVSQILSAILVITGVVITIVINKRRKQLSV